MRRFLALLTFITVAIASGCSTSARRACERLADLTHAGSIIAKPANSDQLLASLKSGRLPHPQIWYESTLGELRACSYSSCGSVMYVFRETERGIHGEAETITVCHPVAR